MDAKEFIKEHQRMCSFYQERGKCNECPAHDPDKSCVMFNQRDMGVVDLVEDWAKDHRALSNDEMMRKTFGEIKIVMAGSVTIKTPDGKVKDFRSWLNDEYVSPPIIEKGCWNCNHQMMLITSYPCSKCIGYKYEADKDHFNWGTFEPEYWEAKDDNKGHV